MTKFTTPKVSAETTVAKPRKVVANKVATEATAGENHRKIAPKDPPRRR